MVIGTLTFASIMRRVLIFNTFESAEVCTGLASVGVANRHK